MPDRIPRRAALIGLGAVCLVAPGGLVVWDSLSDASQAVRAMILRHLQGAMLEPGVLDSFVADFLTAHRIEPNGIAISNVCDGLGIADVASTCINNKQYLRRIEQQVVDLFVRSTDLLMQDRSSDDPIRYVGYWDPYSSACRNPLADFTLGA